MLERNGQNPAAVTMVSNCQCYLSDFTCALNIILCLGCLISNVLVFVVHIPGIFSQVVHLVAPSSWSSSLSDVGCPYIVQHAIISVDVQAVEQMSPVQAVGDTAASVTSSLAGRF